jgi:hypothetical protein
MRQSLSFDASFLKQKVDDLHYNPRWLAGDSFRQKLVTGKVDEV